MSGIFSKSQSSEIVQLRQDLNSTKQDRQKQAVRQVIASMTYGKDVSSLFPDIVKCMYTSSLELKKLVYLYIINYAKSKADLAILAIQTFRNDATNKQNPLLRALAVRTMGCLRIQKITEYLCQTLKDSLTDQDPYVRKTAAVCVAKLFSTNPRMVKDHGFITVLQGMLSDGNSVVVANTVTSLLQISQLSGKNYIKYRDGNVSRIINAVNQSSEWGQVYLLEAISKFKPNNAKEAEDFVERIYPRLTHVNPAVVLAAVKVVLKFMDHSHDKDFVRQATSRLANPLISLLTAPHEIQYIALRNIKFILDKRPKIFDANIKIFFIKFTDPIYVKLEKIEVLKRVVNMSNIDVVISEFKEYSRDFDVDCMRSAISAIGQIIFMVQRAGKKAISLMKDIIVSPNDAAFQEAVPVVMNILRKHPNQYEELLGEVVKRRALLFEPKARCCFTWLLGQFGHCITQDMKREDEEQFHSGFDILQQYVFDFNEEDQATKKQILTSVIKQYLKDPQDYQMKALVKTVFEKASSKDEEPDLRDRAYIYWRMLKNDPTQVEAVVLSEKPPVVADSIMHLSQGGLQLMIDRIGHLSSIVYDIQVEEYSQRQEIRKKLQEEGDLQEDDEIQLHNGDQSDIGKIENNSPRKKNKESQSKNKLTKGKQTQKRGLAKKRGALKGSKSKQGQVQDQKQQDIKNKKQQQQKMQEAKKPIEAVQQVMNLLQLDYQEPVATTATTNSSSTTGAAPSNNLFSFFGGSDFGLIPSISNVQTFSQPQFSMVLQPYTPGSINQSTGFSIQANFIRKDSKMMIHANFGNNSQNPLTDFQIQINLNAFGIATLSQTIPLSSLGPFQKQQVDILCCTKAQSKNDQPISYPQSIQCAIKNSLDVFYFQVPIFLHALFHHQQDMTKEQFDSLVQKLGFDISMKGGKFQAGTPSILEQAEKKMKANGFSVIQQQQQQVQSLLNFGTKIQSNGSPVLVVMKENREVGGVELSAKTETQGIADLLKNSLRLILGVQ